MTDFELFLKYNLKPTSDVRRTEELDRRLFNGEVKWETPHTHKKILLLLHASYKCNANCIYCENQHLRSEYVNAVMDEDTVREIVEKLGPVLREVTWHGGEPLMLPESLIEALEDEKKKRGYCFKTSLQTNSILMTKEKKEFLDKLNIFVGTSFDGLENTTSRGKKSTDAILRCLEEGTSSGFITVTYANTIDNMIKNYEYIKSLGYPGYQNCIVKENVIENSNPYLVPNEIAVPKMLEYIDYWIHDTNAPINDAYVVRQIQRVVGHTTVCDESYCLGGWIIIDPLGNLGHCGHCQQDGGIVNIRDIEDYHGLLTHPSYTKMISKQKKLANTCKDCTWYYVCYGGCMGLNYEIDPTYNTINPRNCEYSMALMQGIYELIKDVDLNRNDLYNCHFINALRQCNYYSLTEIKQIEERYKNG